MVVLVKVWLLLYRVVIVITLTIAYTSFCLPQIDSGPPNGTSKYDHKSHRQYRTDVRQHHERCR